MTTSNEVTERALYDAVAKLIKAKGRFHTEQNYAALVKAFDACTPTAAIPRTSAEALAWRLRIGDSDMWSWADSESDADFHGKQSGMRYEKQPLYAEPFKPVKYQLSDAERGALLEAGKTGATFAEMDGGAIMFINRGEDYGDTGKDLNCPACGGSGHKDDATPAPADSAPMQPAESAILTRQVSEWRKEVARLQDLIGAATGQADSAAERDAARAIAAGYEGGTMIHDPTELGSEIHLHYTNRPEAEAAFEAITNLIDAAMQQKDEK
jgi:hypothetical protein